MVIDWKCQLTHYPGEVMGDMDYSIWPEGFYIVSLAIILGPLAAFATPRASTKAASS